MLGNAVVPSSSANLRRHFLPWDRPLLPQAVAFLAADWAGDGPLDLSALLVIVPTRQSGRRLREALAGFAATKGAAVFPPQVMLPEAFVAAGPPAPDVAPRLEALLAWTEVFRALEPDDFREVFPVDPPARGFAWAFRLAQEFTRLQRTLAENGLWLADVAKNAGDDFAESERWRQIAALGRRHTERLAARALRDPIAAGIDAVQRAGGTPPPVAPEPCGAAGAAPIRRIVVLATPDPPPLALAALAGRAQTVPVDLVVFAPAEEAAAFDEWGRPRPAAWAGRVIGLPDFGRRVHLCADPAAQAGSAAGVTRSYGHPGGGLGIGVADPEVLPLLEQALTQANFAVFNPEGRPRRGDGLYQLLAALAALVRDEAFATVGALARCPDFLDYLRARIGGGFSAARFLAALDRLHTRHLPPTLAEARRQAGPTGEAAAALGLVADVRAELTAGAFPANAAKVLAEIFGARRFDLARPADALAAAAAEAWTGVLRETAAAAARFRDVALAEWWELALRLYGESVHYDDKPAGAVELQGWLELLWEDAPHLVVAGLNDGRVPEAVVGDPFLPESLRERLGLKTNAARFARDAYLLQALAQSRGGSGVPPEISSNRRPAAPGRLDLLLGKTSAAGDPLRPSRLLLRCADGELPRRIGFLFRPAAAARALPAWRRAWPLVPPAVAPPARVAVTGLRAWLACPFRFYLSCVLRMKAVEPGKTELDVFDFGILCHAALEAMGREPALRDCTAAAPLRAFLREALDAAARKQFGAELTLPLLVQLESARQRLARAAEIQAQTRAAGWVIERVEAPFEIEVGGLVVSGKIDRIDRHEATGAWRVLDYKTSDKPVEPWQAHLRGGRRDETAPAFARFPLDGREHVWSDLQLPLYRRALAAACADPGPTGVEPAPGSPRTNPECAYFNLPKAATETGIRHWEGYTAELDEAAWRCAEGVAAAIRAGDFWPPNEKIPAEFDDFASLFQHGAAASVRWEPAGAAVASRPVGDASPNPGHAGTPGPAPAAAGERP